MMNFNMSAEEKAEQVKAAIEATRTKLHALEDDALATVLEVCTIQLSLAVEEKAKRDGVKSPKIVLAVMDADDDMADFASYFKPPMPEGQPN